MSPRGGWTFASAAALKTPDRKCPGGMDGILLTEQAGCVPGMVPAFLHILIGAVKHFLLRRPAAVEAVTHQTKTPDGLLGAKLSIMVISRLVQLFNLVGKSVWRGLTGEGQPDK